MCLISRCAALILEPDPKLPMGVPFDNAPGTALQFIQRTPSRYFRANALDGAGQELGVSAPTGTEQSPASHREHPDPRGTRRSWAGREEGQGAVMEATLG